MSTASVKLYANRNYDGFFNSPEYVNFASTITASTSDKSVYRSPYFGDMTGQIFGSSIDVAFEDFQMRIQNPEMIATPAIGSGNKLNPIHLGLLAATAFYFLS